MLQPSLEGRTVILIPVFHDWEAAGPLLRDLDQALTGSTISPEVLFVDDGSTEPLPEDFAAPAYSNLRRVRLHRRSAGNHYASGDPDCRDCGYFVGRVDRLFPPERE